MGKERGAFVFLFGVVAALALIGANFVVGDERAADASAPDASPSASNAPSAAPPSSEVRIVMDGVPSLRSAARPSSRLGESDGARN